MECSICRKNKFKNNSEKELHLISDDHIKRILEPQVWNIVDDMDDKIKELDIADISTKEKNKQIRKLEVQKRQAFRGEKILDFDDYLKRSSNISKSITS